MLSSLASAVLLLLAGAFCLLAGVGFARTYARHRRSRYNAASWFDAARWRVFLLPVAAGGVVGLLLRAVDLPAPVVMALGALVGLGLVLMLYGLALRCRVRVSPTGVTTWDQLVRWNSVDDYADTATGLALFYHDGQARRRLDVPVPRAFRLRVAQITSACLDARFEYAARLYAGHQALEG